MATIASHHRKISMCAYTHILTYLVLDMAIVHQCESQVKALTAALEHDSGLQFTQIFSNKITS